MKLKDKVAVVTGAGRGIGRTICMKLASEGAKIVVADIDEGTAAKTAQEIKDLYGVDTISVRTDVASKDDNYFMINAAIDAFGTVDILVCNAGITAPAKPIEEVTEESWKRFIGINLMGPIYATQAVVPTLKQKRSGKIVYMASVAGEVGGVATEAPYPVTKAGVMSLTKHVAKQLASFGVTVNAIAPGAIQTDMTEILHYDEKTLASIPLGHLGNVNDIAAATMYLSCSDSDYVTGTTLDVNGGMYMK